jgi:hypothetical protein
VPGSLRAQRVGWLGRCLVLCLAVLLAGGSPARFLPAGGGPFGPAALESPEWPADDPVAGLLAAAPAMLGAVPRPATTEAPPAPPPLKAALLRPGAADHTLLASSAPALQRGEGGELHRSSVGTARTPTGPPS